MRSKAWIVAASLALAAACTAAAQEAQVARMPAEDEEPWVEKAEMRGDAVEMPLTPAGNLLIVEDVRVNGQGPFRFLLDTGAMGAGRIDSSLAAKLGLEPVDEIQVADGSGRAVGTMDVYSLRTLDVGGLHYEGVDVVSRDYNADGAAVWGHIDGVLGYALFEDFLLTIDYASPRMLVERGSLPEPDGVAVVPLQGGGVPGVEIDLGGEKHLARIDTGSMGSVSVSEELGGRLELAGEPVVIGQARMAGGAFQIRSAPLAGKLRIGGQVFDGPEVVIGGALRDINLGGGVLRNLVLTYDQRNGRLRVAPAAANPDASAAPSRVAVRAAPAPAPGASNRRSLGVQLEVSGESGPARVAGVFPGSLAESAGIQAGDVLLEVDGRAIGAGRMEPLGEALSKPDAFRITLERGGERLELEVPAAG